MPKSKTEILDPKIRSSAFHKRKKKKHTFVSLSALLLPTSSKSQTIYPFTFDSSNNIMNTCNSNIFYDNKTSNSNNYCNLDYNIITPTNLNDEFITEINVNDNNDNASMHRHHPLNPYAKSFFSENLTSQINHESPSFDEQCPFDDNDSFGESYHNNVLVTTSRGNPKRKSNRPKLRNSYWKNNIAVSENDTIKITFLSQNVQGLKQDSKLEQIIDQMNEKDIDVSLMQETWLTGDLSRIINGFHILHHGLKNENCRRGERGVAIILSPTGFEACKCAGELPPITSSTSGCSSSGRCTSVNLRIKHILNALKGRLERNV